MSLGLVSPLLNRGVRSRWLASLPGAGSKMLTIDSNGDTSFQDIPVAAWGSITGTLSAQTDLQSALDGKLSLTGGTLTGAVTSNLGTVTTSTPALTINQTCNNAGNTGTVYNLLSSNVSFASNPSFQNQSTYFNFNASGLGGGGTGFLRAFIKDGELYISSEWGAGTITLGTIGVRLSAIYGSGLVVSSTSGSAIFTAGYAGKIINHMGSGGIGASYSFASSGGAFVGDIVCEAANTIVFRNGANAQTFRLYGTYTDASNYRRLYLSSTTAGAFTIGVEGAGTGASGNTLTVPNVLYVTDKIVHRTTNYDLVRLTSSGGEGVINIGNNTSLSAANIFTSVQSNILNIQVSSNIALYANNGMTFLNSAGTARSGINAGVVDFTQPVSTSGSPTAFTLTGAAHTTLTASTEATDVNFNLARTVQFAAGALTTQRAFRIQAPTYSFASASTITTASTLSISGAPVAGTNATITNSYALNVEGGTSNFGGNIQTTGYVQVGSDSARVRLTQNGISNLASGLQYTLISWTGGIIIDAIKISGYAYRGINIERVAGQGGQTWLTVNLEGNSAAFGDTPRQALDVRGNAIIDGNVVLHRSATSTSLQVHNTFTDASNYIRQSLSFTTYSSTVHAQHVVEGAGTGAVNVPFVITPRGTGAFILGPMPDGTATGGNARGQYAVDLQITRTTAGKVASGESTFAAGKDNVISSTYQPCGAALGRDNTVNNGGFAAGWGNTASGNAFSIALGKANTVSGGEGAFALGNQNLVTSSHGCGALGYACESVTYQSIAIGQASRAYIPGQVAQSAGAFSVAGDNQYVRDVLCIKTTNNTPTTLTTSRNLGGAARRTIPSGKLFLFVAKIVGVKSDGTSRACYIREGAIINIAGTTSLVGAITTIGADHEDNAATDVAITADDTNDALDISVTGITSETWRWVAVVEGVEVAYGT